jgi:hypothetical protein
MGEVLESSNPSCSYVSCRLWFYELGIVGYVVEWKKLMHICLNVASKHWIELWFGVIWSSWWNWGQPPPPSMKMATWVLYPCPILLKLLVNSWNVMFDASLGLIMWMQCDMDHLLDDRDLEGEDYA